MSKPDISPGDVVTLEVEIDQMDATTIAALTGHIGNNFPRIFFEAAYKGHISKVPRESEVPEYKEHDLVEMECGERVIIQRANPNDKSHPYRAMLVTKGDIPINDVYPSWRDFFRNKTEGPCWMWKKNFINSKRIGTTKRGLS